MFLRYALLIGLVANALQGSAEHLPGGTISTRCLGGNFHEVTLKLFRACSGAAMIPQDLHFGNDCGVFFDEVGLEPISVEEVSPLCAEDLPNSTCNGGTLVGFELYTYRTTVYLSPCDNWVIAWYICCRNESINVEGSPGLYIETRLNNSGGTCNAAPEFLDNTIPLVCIGQPVSYDASATETDGNTLRYRFIDARFGTPAPFPVLYSGAFSGDQPFTGMTLDSLTGQINFLPTLVGIIVTAVEVKEYNSEGDLLGTVMRDFPFVVSACENAVPSVNSGTFTEASGTASIVGERALQVCSEGPLCASLAFADADLDQTLVLTSNVATILPGATLELSGTNPVSAELCWNSTGVAFGTYQFSITATDDACPVQGFQQFTYTVSVEDAPSSGESSDLVICENGEPVNLFDLLGGDPDPNGTWSDPDSQGSDGSYIPGTSLPGIWSYTVQGSGDCFATSVVNITELPNTAPECIGLGLDGTTLRRMRIQQDGANPSVLWIHSPRSLDVIIEARSMDGRLVGTGRASLVAGIAARFELSQRSSGMYVLSLRETSSGRKTSTRFVVP